MALDRRSLLKTARSLALVSALCGFPLGDSPAAEIGPMVETQFGRIRGWRDQGVAIFSGVPYAGRADNQNRFMAPVPAESWTGIRECTVLGPRAIQRDMWPHQRDVDLYWAGGRQGLLDAEREPQSENCLVLNILTPQVGLGKRPVMVYLHGGAFLTGSGIIALGAHAFVREQDVVLVSVNHRLNVFGYLYLGSLAERYADSGNVGMLDIILALQWVRNNIEQFGGDADNVTIFGESGGGWKVSTLLAMPAAKGLFHRAIIESGSAISALSAEEGTERVRKLIRYLDIGEHDLHELVRMPAEVLLSRSSAAGLNDPAAMWPVIDGRNLLRNPFTPDAPSLAKGVPLIVGHCAEEDTVLDGLADESLFRLSEADLYAQLKQQISLTPPELRKIIALYRGEDPRATPSDLFFRIASDWDFGVESTTQADRKVVQGDAVYKYRFDYAPPIEERKFGAFHCAELPLVLRRVVYPESEPLSRTLANAWAAFARSGDPSQPGLVWPRYSLECRETMLFNLESRVSKDPRKEIRIAWSELPPPPFPHTSCIAFGCR